MSSAQAMDLTTLDTKPLIGVASAVGGALLTLITQQILNKRGLFTHLTLNGK